jgi:hypothetical protein
MSGLRAPATAAAVVSPFIIALMMPLVLADAAPRTASRDADMEFLEYLGTFEAGGESVDPLALEQLEIDKKRKEMPVETKRRFRVEERTSEKDAGNE